MKNLIVISTADPRKNLRGSALFYKKLKIALKNFFLFFENVLFFGFKIK